IQGVIALQVQMAKEIGKQKMSYAAAATKTDVAAQIKSQVSSRIAEVLSQPLTKEAREAALDTIEDTLKASLTDIDPAEIKSSFDAALKSEVRNAIIDRGVRPDGRGLKEIRPIS